MVSRYAVDVFMIGGLIIGTLGVLYLAEGLFGQRGHALFHRLLVALGWAVFSSATYYALGVLNPKTQSPLSSIIFGAAIGGLGIGFGLTDFYQLNWHKFRKGDISGRLVYAGGALVPVILMLSNVFVAHESIFFASLVAGYSAVLLLIGPAFDLLSGFSGRQLQVVGLILTLLGIATQFIPPILDLLNIKVV